MSATCVLSWEKAEAGVETKGEQNFWIPFPDVMPIVKRRMGELRKLGGTWTFKLHDSNGVEVSLETPEPVELR
jgi:hypothetical protein